MVWTLGPSWRDLGPCVAWRETTIQWPTSHVLQIPSQCQYVHAQEKCITTHTLMLGSCRTYFYSSSHLLCWRLSTSLLFHFPSCPGFSLNLLSLEWLHIFLLRSLRESQSKTLHIHTYMSRIHRVLQYNITVVCVNFFGISGIISAYFHRANTTVHSG